MWLTPDCRGWHCPWSPGVRLSQTGWWPAGVAFAGAWLRPRAHLRSDSCSLAWRHTSQEWTRCRPSLGWLSSDGSLWKLPDARAHQGPWREAACGSPPTRPALEGGPGLAATRGPWAMGAAQQVQAWPVLTARPVAQALAWIPAAFPVTLSWAWTLPPPVLGHRGRAETQARARTRPEHRPGSSWSKAPSRCSPASVETSAWGLSRGSAPAHRQPPSQWP